VVLIKDQTIAEVVGQVPVFEIQDLMQSQCDEAVQGVQAALLHSLPLQ